MPNADEADTTQTEAPTPVKATKTAAKPKKSTTPAGPTKAEEAAAEKALATFHETRHVPAGWVYSRGVMQRREKE